MAWTFRHSWTDGLVPVGLGRGRGWPSRCPSELGDGEAEAEVDGLLLGLAEALLLGLAEALLLGLAEALLLGLAEALLLGVAEALSEAFGVALAVALALAVAVALLVAAGWLLVALGLLVALALPLAEGDGELLDLAVLDVCFLGVLDDETEATSRTMAVWPAGTERAAEVVAAGGWPHTLGAATVDGTGVRRRAAAEKTAHDGGRDEGRTGHDTER